MPCQQVFQAGFGLTGHTLQNGESIVGIVRIGVELKNISELIPGFVIESGIQKGNGIVVLLFRIVEREVIRPRVPLAGYKIDA